ncbi:Xbp1p CYBJADRAFT_167736 [Cyberlindnera jadinii NRRL Y-1542]|uniref:HTH APSES-type domain-containing protein n=1 Tax=Cyberlindnera jadinii (strain ATCC 18201 / CBS 1600 / BCRC 20928 / JCM 3617 / NBRC 0987 / NRRL Y-1542) TaxID=983966 RepID=A0A1E4S2J4_CYBJN|nr:hypothetical protein CYBJADRAFT_167736 [Cyberlindnera jadinii NRRL Y-1542]ODV73728.1 hypothetical protein CYBJADRAFT_167736 [Cyberlindnera jadinii NRRL Y-1542]
MSTSHKSENIKQSPTRTRRRSSISLSAKLQLENTMLLNSVPVNYPLYAISEQTRRYIPQSQRELISGYLDEPHTTQSVIQRKKYSTNIDERNFISVYEYQINDHWIIWDYSTGFVFFTGLWKACGNTKTDIVKLVENFPSLQTCVRRIRGGFLKIQGTWLPYDKARELAKNFSFNIRYCLVPIFGDSFPDECLKPTHPNFGKLVDINAPPVVKQRRRSTANHSSSASHTNNKTGFKPRRSHSQSEAMSRNTPIVELQEVLKASKQLHHLSSSHIVISPRSSTSLENYSLDRERLTRKRTPSFNYGGFVWSWNDLKILGKDDEHAVIDEDETSVHLLPPISHKGNTEVTTNFPTPMSSAPQLSTATTNSPSAHNQGSSSYISDMTPKSYNGYETVVNAAQQLLCFSNSRGDGEVVNTPIKDKMDIGGLLS